ncbi:MAG: hypothetical protein CVT69_00260 [Actinobacteria bacterium HGW-Actinobacteria-9]|jgi:Tfp pilus assembly protein FimV|nr:MAG: hypothetical protein CVT69_00260 [Actinobacteria bacterium HGW-Actinobacteria-9]
MQKTPQRQSATVRASRQTITPLEMVLLMLVLCALVYAAMTGDKTGTAPSDLHTTTIRVRPTDTLWRVASTYPVEGLDTAQTVSLIQELNEMSDSGLAAGQVLLVPAKVGAETAMASLD